MFCCHRRQGPFCGARKTYKNHPHLISMWPNFLAPQILQLWTTKALIFSSAWEDFFLHQSDFRFGLRALKNIRKWLQLIFPTAFWGPPNFEPKEITLLLPCTPLCADFWLLVMSEQPPWLLIKPGVVAWLEGDIGEEQRVYLLFRWVLSAMWLCNIGHFHSCCPSPVLDILLEIPRKIQYLITHVCIILVILHVFKISYELKNIEQCYLPWSAWENGR